jgi:ABC-type uncharacterized transport system permease subunit
MRSLIAALGNGALSFAISVTVVLTVTSDADGPWDRREIALTAGIAAFVSGVCASYFGENLRRLVRQKAL